MYNKHLILQRELNEILYPPDSVCASIMARKKTKRRAQQPASIKSRPGKLDRVFTCPVCHHERSVECKL